MNNRTKQKNRQKKYIKILLQFSKEHLNRIGRHGVVTMREIELRLKPETNPYKDL